MARVTFTVDGAADIQRELRKLGRKVNLALSRAALAAGDVFKQELKKRAPRRTGLMRRSMEHRLRKAKLGNVLVNVGPTKDAFYAQFYELGTKHQPARPFMRPAFDDKKALAQREALRVLRSAIVTLGGKF